MIEKKCSHQFFEVAKISDYPEHDEECKTLMSHIHGVRRVGIIIVCALCELRKTLWEKE